MRAWRKSELALKCGKCAATLAPGTAFLTIKTEGMKRELIRCEHCVGERAPDVFASVAQSPLSFTRISDLAKSFDPKQAQVGERE